MCLLASKKRQQRKQGLAFCSLIMFRFRLWLNMFSLKKKQLYIFIYICINTTYSTYILSILNKWGSKFYTWFYVGVFKNTRSSNVLRSGKKWDNWHVKKIFKKVPWKGGGGLWLIKSRHVCPEYNLKHNCTTALKLKGRQIHCLDEDLFVII